MDMRNMKDDFKEIGQRINKKSKSKKTVEEIRAEKESKLQADINKACEYKANQETMKMFENMPKDTRDLTLSDIKSLWDPEEIYLVNKAIDSAFNFKKTRKGIYMYSKQTGTGKTTLMASLARGIRNHYKVSIFFASEDYILDKIKSSYRDDTELSEDKFIKYIASHEAIFIDELGQSTSEWATKTLKKLLDEIINNGSKLYITSNYGLNDLEKRLKSKQNDPDSQAVIQLLDRIRSLTEPLEFGNKSYR